MTHKRQNHN